jgi:hypothetical protein
MKLKVSLDKNKNEIQFQFFLNFQSFTRITFSHH